MAPRLILVGVIGRPHGVRGLLRVNAYTGDPAALAAYAPLRDKNGRSFGLEWVSGEIARLTEFTDAGARPVADREAAGRLTNTELFAPRSAFPPAGEDEFYLTDLLGLSARDAGGRPLGTITAVHDYGGGASLEIGGLLLIPFTRATVPVIDLHSGQVVIEAPAETEGAQ